MSEEKTIISNVNEAYTFVGSCAPYKIRKSVLSVPGKEDCEVYVIALRGTNRSFDTSDPLGIPVAVRAGCSKDNIYHDLVKKAIFTDIPVGSKIMFFGHSLGGMVCQQLGADKDIMEYYDIQSVLTFGSPYVPFDGKKCPLHRMAEIADIVPVMCSVAFFANPFLGEVAHESAGYFFNILGAHCDSYEKSDVWKKYDCFGIKNGGRKVTF